MLTRRRFMTAGAALLAAGRVDAQDSGIWSALRTHEALLADEARLLDIRSRQEWKDTGVAQGAWPVSLHEPRFALRLFAARDLAGGRPVALICAVGGRTGAVMRVLTRDRVTGFVDVSEGMLGSPAGPGWIARSLPIVTADEALKTLPEAML